MFKHKSQPYVSLRHSASSPDVRMISHDEHSHAHSTSKQQILAPTPGLSSEDAQRAEDYSCNICFEIAGNSVVTACGHLYCWSCLYQWLASPSQALAPMCPVCKAGCDISSLTPIYGRGNVVESQAVVKVKHKQVSTMHGNPSKPRSILDEWLLPHLHPPSLPVLPNGAPARPSAHPQPVRRTRKLNSFVTQAPQGGIFGTTHPIVIFSAGITTLCGMQILQNGGFTSMDPLDSSMNTTRMMWLLAFLIIAGVWFH